MIDVWIIRVMFIKHDVFFLIGGPNIATKMGDVSGGDLMGGSFNCPEKSHQIIGSISRCKLKNHYWLVVQ